MGVAVGHFLLQSHFFQGFLHQFPSFGFIFADPVHLQPLADDLLDGETGREGREGILENDLDLSA